MYKFLDVQMQTYLLDELTRDMVTFEGDESSAKEWLESQFGHAAGYFKPVEVLNDNN